MTMQTARGEDKKSRNWQWLFNAVLLIGAITFAVILFEVVLHVLRPQIQYTYMPQDIVISHFQPSSFLPAELRPNYRSRFKMLEFDTIVTTNRFGLRDEEVDFSRPRILCLGDSYTFGYGVENDETFCALLERRFGKKYDFVNVGFADGFSPDSYALWLAKYKGTFDPTAIIVSLFPNDFDEVSSNIWYRNGRIMREDDPGLPDKIVKPHVIVTPDGNLMRDNFMARMPVLVRRLLRNSYLVALIRDRLLDDAQTTVAHDSDAKPDNRKFLHALEMLHTAAGDRLLAFYFMGWPGQTAPLPTDELAMKFAATHHIAVFSNYQDFSSQEFLMLDPHWNRLGHQKAADYLYSALSSLGL